MLINTFFYTEFFTVRIYDFFEIVDIVESWKVKCCRLQPMTLLGQKNATSIDTKLLRQWKLQNKNIFKTNFIS